jgi:hypothetical protein
MPPGQTTSYDDRETVEEAWVEPSSASPATWTRAPTSACPPPQIRTLLELAQAGAASPRSIAAAAARAAPTSRAGEGRVFADLGGGQIGAAPALGSRVRHPR